MWCLGEMKPRCLIAARLKEADLQGAAESTVRAKESYTSAEEDWLV